MFTVTVDDAMLARLREMLEDEDDGVRVRLREYKHGGGCHAKFILGLGMAVIKGNTMKPDEEEDICIDIDGVPFVAARDFLDKYGKRFSLGYNANREVLLEALDA